MVQAVKFDENGIIEKLAKLQSDVDFIKEYIVDSSMSEEDIKAIKDYENEKKEGMLISHEDLKNELDV